MTAPLIATPTFVNGALVHMGDLNRLSYDIDALAQIALGKAAAASPSTKPIAKVNLTAGQNVPTGAGGTTRIVSWDQNLVDTDGMWNAATPTLLTIKTPGWYRILLQTRWASGSASERVAQILVNGTSDPLNVAAAATTTMGSTGAVTQQCLAYEHLAAGATVYGGIFQNSGSTIQLLANGSWGTYMTVAYADPF